MGHPGVIAPEATTPLWTSLFAAVVCADMAVRRTVAIVGAILVMGIVVSGWSSASSRSVLDPAPDGMGVANTAAGTTIAINDVRLTVPAGWDSESFVNPSGMTVFRLGSFEFRHASDDDVGQTAQASMRATDVLINIVDVTATEAGATNPYYRPLPLPLTVDGSHAVQQEGYEAPAAVIRGVRIDAHSFYLSVAFGSAPPSDAQVAAADAVLRTLTVR